MRSDGFLFLGLILVAHCRDPHAGPSRRQVRHAGFNKASEESLRHAKRSMLLELGSKILMRGGQVDAEGVDEKTRFRRMSKSKTILAAALQDHGDAVLDEKMGCPEEIEETMCQNFQRQRTFSGRCNNLKHPNYGKLVIPYMRLLPPDYDDGISRPRQLSSNRKDLLPNVRVVSNIMHGNESKLDPRYTLMLMQFGQFLDHDISSTPMARDPNGEIIDCEDCNSGHINPNCFPIMLPKNDRYFKLKDGRKTCLPFTRSLPGQDTFGPRDQLNQNTGFIDASHLYGSNPCRCRELREPPAEGRRGRLKMLQHPWSKMLKPLMPRHKENEECEAPSGECFLAGDDRNNEQPGLVIIHTVYVREHNRLADQLAAANPHWADERVFQEARKILMAINQHITYNEFLPRVLGPDVTGLYGLRLEQSYFKGYNPSCSPDIVNEFATAAFRFGHSLIRPSFRLMADNRRRQDDTDGDVRLRDHFNNPDVVMSSDFIDSFLRGVVSSPIERFDRSITSELTDHLFQNPDDPFSGMDLAALNLQRGRDHGIPGYMKYRKVCGLSVADDFSDLPPIVGLENAERLRSVYRHVDDIDLFTGGLAERPLRGAIVGPTFACIIGYQFRALRLCDRFWYESADPLVRFTPAQLDEIRRVTLASLLCRNADMPMKIQRWAFDRPDPDLNPAVACSTLPTIDVTHWTDQPSRRMTSCEVNGRIIPVGATERVSACEECECGSRMGVQCYSIKVESCRELIDDVGEVMAAADKNCVSQCPELV